LIRDLEPEGSGDGDGKEAGCRGIGAKVEVMNGKGPDRGVMGWDERGGRRRRWGGGSRVRMEVEWRELSENGAANVRGR